MKTSPLLLASALLAGSFGAYAEEQTPANTAGEYEGAVDEGGIDEIVVTALKRSQSLQDVPLAITAFTSEALANAGVVDMYDVATLVPSFSVQQNTSPINVQFRLRGLGPLANIPNFEPSAAYFSDGAFRPRSGLAMGDLIDLDRIEILKGPQSTLYGKNASAGVIAVYTREPGDSFEFRSEVGAASVDGAQSAFTWGAKAAVSGPVSDTVSLGLTGSYFSQEPLMFNPFLDSDFNEVSRYNLRGQAVWRPTDALKLRLIVANARVEPSPGNGESDFFYGVQPAAINAAFGVPCSDNDPTNRIVCRNFAGDAEMEYNEATLIATYELANGYELSSLTSWDDYEATKILDADQLNVDLLTFQDRQAGDSLQQELRITSPAGGKFEWLAGAMFYGNDAERGNWGGHPMFTLGAAAPLIPIAPMLPAGQPGDTGDLISNSSTDYWGIFSQATWRPFEKFSITGGVRYQEEDKETTTARSLNHAGLTLISTALLPPTTAADLSRSTDAWTWTLTPQYDFNDDVMAYATLSRGFKSGGFNGDFGRVLPSQREFGDETVKYFETGIKSRLADGRVILNANYFYSDHDQYQEAGFVALQFLVTNAPEVTAKGFEVELAAEVTDELTANFAFTYADTKFADFPNGSCYPGNVPNSTGGCDLTGYPLSNAPLMKSHLGLQYERPITWGEFFARADWTYSADYYTNSNHDPRQIQSSYDLLGLRLGVRHDNWVFTAWGDNLLDETYVTQSGVSNLFATDPAYQSFIAPGIGYGVTIGYSF
jgi:outer membrane receptor protein involved in Fe transport